MMNTVSKKTITAIALIFIISLEACKDNEIDSVRAADDKTRLPIGDSKILRRDNGQSLPAKESLWLCGVPPNGAGNSNATDWTNSDGTWDYTRKPMVTGSVSWTSTFNVTLDGNGNRNITGNGLPNHPTGVFPIDPASAAYQYDRNPNAIKAYTINYVFAEIPTIAATPNCLTFGPSGFSLTGGAIYHGSSTLANDAAAHEMLDSYGGQSDGTNTYHYHYLADNLRNLLDPPGSGHSALMGYMRDGFGIYGPRGEDGKVLASKDLDECHGHTHSVLWDGKMINLYHYHWTYDFPYNIGCYKGTPK